MDKKTVFIIFGSTWDLAKRMIFPALFNIIAEKQFSNTEVIWIWRRNFDKKKFVDFVYSNTKEYSKWTTKKTKDQFFKKLQYFNLEIDKIQDYYNLENYLKSNYWKNTEIIVYLSISPQYFIKTLTYFKKSGLHQMITRIAFEKPFGHDLASATKLNKWILKIFQENQIFRIDHYLWKEAIQNITAFRFSNIMFEPIWNNKYIDNIQITASEEIWVENRGEYYDENGAIRDMLQNHLFQVLSLICMEMPNSLDSKDIKESKYNVLKNIWIEQITNKDIVLWQYEWYKQEKGVKKTSKTETFVALKVFVNNWRFDWVPIYMRTWKKLWKKETKVVIEFKTIPKNLFNQKWEITQNRIIIQVAPDESININFNIKEIWKNNIKNVNSKFFLDKQGTSSYERLVKDLIMWDATLFTPWKIIEQSWKIVDNIINCNNDCPMVYKYSQWSYGPELPCKKIMKNGKKWFNS